ncbi:MAG: aspartate aminotransferase family protein [Deltaproteobacteria bacterium]|nr:aspartate aminotransferase family protein [Deltaproteobacteria bacterium]
MSGLGFDPGFVAAGGEGPWIRTEDGRLVLDGLSGEGICTFGRRPPALVAALAEALDGTDQGNFPMISREKAAFAAALAAWAPGDLEGALFAVMRGEALDGALKVARGHTGRATLVTVDGGWYGETGFALSLSDRPGREAFGPLLPQTRTVPFGDLAAAETELARGAAAFVLEPLQAENRCREAEPRYLQGLRELCNRHGALLVLDETWTGLGRTGRPLACERAGIIPDILVLGEALGAGLFPIAAALLRRGVKRFLDRHPLIHLSTFGGSDLGCRVGVAVLEAHAMRRPWERAAVTGAALREGLEVLRSRRPGALGSVSGRGLLLSLDLGSPERALAFCRAAADRDLLVRPQRVARAAVLLAPPLTLEPPEQEALLARVEGALDATDGGAR